MQEPTLNAPEAGPAELRRMLLPTHLHGIEQMVKMHRTHRRIAGVLLVLATLATLAVVGFCLYRDRIEAGAIMAVGAILPLLIFSGFYRSAGSAIGTAVATKAALLEQLGEAKAATEESSCP